MGGRSSWLRGSNAIGSLDPGIRALVREFRKSLSIALEDNLVGLYVLGSAAFPGFNAFRADIDFHAITHEPPGKQQMQILAAVHGRVSRRFRFGNHLDGFYIPLAQARKTRRPENLIGVARGRLLVTRRVRDEAWALHREHLYNGGYLHLHGPPPTSIYKRPSTRAIRAELGRELRYIGQQALKNDRPYSVLNLCRLILTWRTGNVAVSKRQSGNWAQASLAPEWTPLIRAALGAYRGKVNSRDERELSERTAAFYCEARMQIVEAMARSPLRTPSPGQYRRD